MRKQASKGAHGTHFQPLSPMTSLAEEHAAHAAAETERQQKRFEELSRHLIPGQTKVTCRSATIGRVYGTYKGVSSSNRLEVIDDATNVVFSFRPTELHL